MLQSVPLPWRLRRALSLAYANRRAPQAMLAAKLGRPRLRIMISTPFFGGVGGIEKLLMSVVESMPDCFFYVMTREVRTEGFVPATANYVVNVAAPRGAALDVYFYFAGGGRPAYLGDDYAFTARVVDTCGADIRDIEHRFDWIAIQTGNAGRYSRAPEKWQLMFPEMRVTFPAGRTPVPLPGRYLATVFNPYSDKFKGGDTLFSVAAHSALPLVWCFSDRSGASIGTVPDHPNVIKLKNLSQEQLYYVYEHAAGYVSFSHSEGLGWAIAEAFYCGLPLVTREVGFVTYVKGQRGVHVYASEEELCRLLACAEFEPPAYDYSELEAHSFSKMFDHIVDQKSGRAVPAAG